jgi:serine/threonine protein kinase
MGCTAVCRSPRPSPPSSSFTHALTAIGTRERGTPATPTTWDVKITAADEGSERKPKNGGYRLGKTIALGGYAEVFRAEHRERPGQLVAFKRPRSNVPLARERMAREIEVQRLFEHPHIMPILDAAEDGSWFVMPLAQGNLEGLWKSGVLGSNARLIATVILDPVIQGLEPAHARGYVHRTCRCYQMGQCVA